MFSAEEAEEERVRTLRSLQEEGESTEAGQGEAQVILRAAGLESQLQEPLHESKQGWLPSQLWVFPTLFWPYLQK